MIRSYLKFEIDYLSDKISFRSTKQKKNHEKAYFAFLFRHILVFASVLHRMMSVGHTYSSQFMEWQNLGIVTLKHATCAPYVFKKLSENQITTDFIYLISSNFVTMSRVNYWDQFNSWKNLWKFWNGPLCRKKSGLFSLLNVAGYWKSSNIKVSAKKLSRILANNINHRGRRIGLRIYVKYWGF